jgi:hypothetical protein
MGRNRFSPPDTDSSPAVLTAATDADRAAGSSIRSNGYSTQKSKPGPSVDPGASLSSSPGRVVLGAGDADLGLAASPAHLSVRPQLGRALSGGIGLLSQPKSASKLQPAHGQSSSSVPFLLASSLEETGALTSAGDAPASEGTARENASAAGCQPPTTSSASEHTSSAQAGYELDSSCTFLAPPDSLFVRRR